MVRSEHTFWEDPESGTTRTYDDLIGSLNALPVPQVRVDAADPYILLVRLLHALASGYGIDVTDANSLEREDVAVGRPEVRIDDAPPIRDWDDLVHRIVSHQNDALVGLYTSGTTGEPKRVAHSFASLTKGVKTGDHHRAAVWALAYHPSHIAAIHVFFQAFLNKNAMVYVFPLSGKRLLEVLEQRGITHISATPTFYRQLLLSDWSPLAGVRAASCGGEPVSSDLLTEMEALFPNAKIRNIYALTEAGSLFASDGDTFTISPAMRDSVRISEDGELLLHTSVLAHLEDNPAGEWYHTGDIIERTDSSRFRIVHRDTDLINVGGYSVDPHEVERVIMDVEGVVDVVVRGRPNRITGNVLEAIVVKASDRAEADFEDRIHRYVKSHLQPHKVPRIVRFASEVDLTRTGKKERK